MTVSTESTESAGTLVYLFCDEVVGEARGVWSKVPGSTMPVPCKNIKVFKHSAAESILAATFWSLRERGLVSLELHTSGLLFFKRETARVSVQRNAEVAGIDGDVLRAAAVNPGKDVWLVVYAWIGSKHLDPYAWVMKQTQFRSAAKGYFRLADAHRNAVDSLVRGNIRAEEDPEKINSSRGAFEVLHRDWEAFKTAEPALYNALLRGCRAGIQAQQERLQSATFAD